MLQELAIQLLLKNIVVNIKVMQTAVRKIQVIKD